MVYFHGEHKVVDRFAQRSCHHPNALNDQIIFKTADSQSSFKNFCDSPPVSTVTAASGPLGPSIIWRASTPTPFPLAKPMAAL